MIRYLFVLLAFPVAASATRVSSLKVSGGFDGSPAHFIQGLARIGVDDNWQLRLQGGQDHNQYDENLNFYRIGANYKQAPETFAQAIFTHEQLSDRTDRDAIEPLVNFPLSEQVTTMVAGRFANIHNSTATATQSEFTIGFDWKISSSFSTFVEYEYSAYDDPDFLVETLGLSRWFAMGGVEFEIDDQSYIYAEYSQSKSVTGTTSHFTKIGAAVDLTKSFTVGVAVNDTPGGSAYIIYYW